MNKKFTITLLGTVATCILGASSVFASTGIVTGNSVRIREKASTDSSIIETISKDTKIEVVSEEGDWYKITYDNKEGYIHKDYVEVEEETEDVNNTATIEETGTNSENDNQVEENTGNEESVDENKKAEIGNTLTSDSSIYLTACYSSSEIGSLKDNTKVSVEKTISNWSYISYKNTKGWIPNYKLIEVDSENKEESTETEKNENTNQKINKQAYLSSSSANLRKGPGTNYETIGGIAENEVITVLEEKDGWYKVETADNLTGYVLKELVTLGERKTTSRSGSIRMVTPVNLEENEKKETTEKKEDKKDNSSTSNSSSSADKKRKELVAYAKKYLGYKYVRGGSSPKTGFDCSGFTKYVYGHFGYSLNRTSSGQANNGTKVKKSNLKQGDLLIFTGHVGIYIGNNKFIHAANPDDGVKITSLSDSYYVRNYIEARRIIK